MTPMRTMAAQPKHASPSDLSACRDMLRHGSKSFHLASKLLPQRAREPAGALYAFCRMADDAVDLEDGGPETLARLSALLNRVYAASPANDPVERALADTVSSFAIPRPLLDALLEGLAWDEAGKRYDTLADLRAYGARVASTVGVITTLMMGVRDPVALARAADLGVAMQLTNIARDVGEDARNGRLYLPESWMREVGLSPNAWLDQPVFDHRLAAVVQRLLESADRLYARSKGGIALLPWDCRTGIHAARLIYAEIGKEVERQDFNSISQRAIVGKGRKLRLLATAFGASVIDSGRRSRLAPAIPPLDETRFLIDAAVSSQGFDQSDQQTTNDIAWWDVRERIIRTIDLFTRLTLEEKLHRER